VPRRPRGKSCRFAPNDQWRSEAVAARRSSIGILSVASG
jgi:hypothetical protein